MRTFVSLIGFAGGLGAFAGGAIGQPATIRSTALGTATRAGEVFDSIDSLCRGRRLGVIRLQSHEFRFSGYDSELAIAGLIAPAELPPGPDRTRRVKFHRDATEPILFHLPPDELLGLFAAQRESQLQLDFAVQWIPDREKTGAEDDGACPDGAIDVRPVRMTLSNAQVPVVERDLSQDLVVEVRRISSVRVASINADEGSPTVDGKSLEPVIETIARDCHDEVLETSPLVQGSLMMSIEKSPVGLPRRPRVSIDLLYNPALVHCLQTAMLRSRKLWTGMPAGARLNVPLYFRPVLAEVVEARPVKERNAP